MDDPRRANEGGQASIPSRSVSPPWRYLKALPRIGDYVFPGAVEGKPLSDMALMQLLRGMDANGYKVHGFRSTFRDWAGDLDHFERETIEHALAHQLPDKRRSRLPAQHCAEEAGAVDASVGQLLRRC